MHLYVFCEIDELWKEKLKNKRDGATYQSCFAGGETWWQKLANLGSQSNGMVYAPGGTSKIFEIWISRQKISKIWHVPSEDFISMKSVNPPFWSKPKANVGFHGQWDVAINVLYIWYYFHFLWRVHLHT